MSCQMLQGPEHLAIDRMGATCDVAEVPRLFCLPPALAPRFLPLAFPPPEPPLLASPMNPGASVRTMLTTVGHFCRRAATTGASRAAASAAGAVTKCTMCTPEAPTASTAPSASETLPMPVLLPMLLHKSPFTAPLTLLALLLSLLLSLLLLLLPCMSLVLLRGDVVTSEVSDCPGAAAPGGDGVAGPLRMPMRRRNPYSGCLPRPATSLSVHTASGSGISIRDAIGRQKTLSPRSRGSSATAGAWPMRRQAVTQAQLDSTLKGTLADLPSLVTNQSGSDGAYAA